MIYCKNCRALEKIVIQGKGYIPTEVRYNCALNEHIVIIEGNPCSKDCKSKTTRRIK